MAVGRTGINQAAKKPHSERSRRAQLKQGSVLPRGERSELYGALGFFGKPLKEKSLSGWIGFILQLIGKPLYWGLVSGLLALVWFSLFAGKTTLNTGKLILRLALKILLKTVTLSGQLLFAFFLLVRKLQPKKTKILKTKWLKISLLRLKLRFLKFKGLKIRYRPGKKSFALITLLLLISTFSFLIFNLILKNLPDPNRLITRRQIVSTKIYDRHGKLLYKIYQKQNRTLVPLSEIPMPMIQATIAIEDAEFYHHRGFSIKGIVRAFFQNLKGDKLYGGSTITQQLVKNTLLTPERTVTRKLKEVVLALWAEQKFSKDEILQMYLNEVGYGGAVYGAEEAAQTYFGKSVKNLNLSEASLLAGLPASPTTYSPLGTHPEKAKERQVLVLARMEKEGFITSKEAEEARQQELHFIPQRTDIKAPHFVMYVKELLIQKYGFRQVEEDGLQVITSLDLDLQNSVQEIVSQEVAQLERLHITNGAALVTRPNTGEVLAMVGSRDYFDLANDGNVNVTLRPRQPGSAIKPVNYSVALENGFTPATIIPDTPITYLLPGQPPYSPKNYDDRFHGNVPLRVALGSSYNVPAVKVLSSLGVERMIRRGQEMGITTWDDPSRFGLSLTLGGGEVKMVDLAVVYDTLANSGNKVNLNPILEVKDYKGRRLERASIFTTPSLAATDKILSSLPVGIPVLDPRIAYILSNILADNAARIPAFGPSSVLNIPDHPHVAVKTGTTQNMRDNWTVGYTPDYVATVWVGNNDNTPMSYVASGITGASPIWNKIMSLLLKDVPDKEFPRPEGLSRVEICPSTGTLPCEGCGGKWEYFLPGTEPKAYCVPKKKREEKREEEKITSDQTETNRIGPTRTPNLHIINYRPLD